VAELIEFTGNYNDLSTQQGFQWEFFCERCGNGYRSGFRASATGVASEVMDAAGSLLGGIFGTAASLTDRVHSAAWERAHDDAFRAAAAEIRPHFVQCPRCNDWVCRQRCWNEARGLCVGCAPDIAVETASAQQQAMTDQAVEKVRARQYDVTQYVTGDRLQAACPACGAAVKPGAKFCSECGSAVKQGRFCTACGAALEARARFCPECGARQG